jgi:hypothetical protein
MGLPLCHVSSPVIVSRNDGIALKITFSTFWFCILMGSCQKIKNSCDTSRLNYLKIKYIASHWSMTTHSHEHAHEHGHSHEILDHPGSFLKRDPPLLSKRIWKERAFTVGIGGPVGTTR